MDIFMIGLAIFGFLLMAFIIVKLKSKNKEDIKNLILITGDNDSGKTTLLYYVMINNKNNKKLVKKQKDSRTRHSILYEPNNKQTISIRTK